MGPEVLRAMQQEEEELGPGEEAAEALQVWFRQQQQVVSAFKQQQSEAGQAEAAAKAVQQPFVLVLVDSESA